MIDLHADLRDTIAELEAALEAADLGDVTVTADAREAPGRLQSGRAVIIVAAPHVDMSAPGVYTVTFQALIIAPDDAPERALGTLGPILGAISDLLTEAEADTFHTPAGPFWYGYAATIHH